MCLTPRSNHLPIASFSSINVNEASKHSDFDLTLIPKCDYVEETTAYSYSSESNIFRILQYNIRELVNKQDDLKKLLNTHHIDVALLCETWLNDYNLHRIDICGYDLLYHNRSTKKGGGVCILVKDSLKYRSYDIKADMSILEHISVEIKTNTRNLLLTSAYRPPNTNSRTFINEYQSLLKCHQDSKLKSFIGIDHNMDLFHCDQHPLTQEFLELNYSYTKVKD